MSFKFIDMFAGIGGFHVGLSRLGGEAVWACEINDLLADVYESNFKLRPAGDIKEVDYDVIPDHDVLCAGFPCQPFSIIRSRDRKGEEHEKGDLFSYILKVLQAKKPSFFILENVVGLKNINNGKTFSDILIALQREGYDVDYYQLCCQDFNVPQSRLRLFIIGSKKGITLRLLTNKKIKQTKEIENPLAKVKDINTEDQAFVQDTIESRWVKFYRDFYLKFGSYQDLPKILISSEFGATYPYIDKIFSKSSSLEELKDYNLFFGKSLEEVNNELPSYLTSKVVPKQVINESRFFYEKHQKEIDTFLEANLSALNPFSHKSKYRLNLQKMGERFNDEYAHFYTFYSSISIHYNAVSCLTTNYSTIPYWLKEDRYFTLNECLRAMGFNDGEIILPNKIKMHSAIGNSVSPTIIEHLGNALINKKSTYLPIQHKHTFL